MHTAIQRLYGEGHAWVSPWVATLPESYFLGYDSILRNRYYKNAEFLETPAGKLDIQRQVFIRMGQAKGQFIPWVEKILPLAGKRVLEIGCGTGSSTVSLLLSGASVHAIDIDTRSPSLVSERIELLGAPDNVSYEVVTPDWLSRDDAYDWSKVDADIIVCYALIEHLTIIERLVLLYNAMKSLPVGGHIVIHETPNRLAAVDWHSTMLPFSEILPDELAQMNLTKCKRTDRPTHIVKHTLDDPADDIVGLYRRGRGVSFHEFELAVGLESFDVVHDGAKLKERTNPLMPVVPEGSRKAYINGLQGVLDALGIHKAFAYSSLDLVLCKVAEPRRFDLN